MAAPPTPFAERLWQAMNALPRDASGKRQNDAAIERAAGLNKGVIWKILHGRQKTADADTMLDLAAELGVTAEWLGRGKGQPPTPSGFIDPPPWANGAEALPDVDIALEFLRRGGVTISEDAERRVRDAGGDIGDTTKEWARRLIDAQARIDKDRVGHAPAAQALVIEAVVEPEPLTEDGFFERLEAANDDAGLVGVDRISGPELAAYSDARTFPVPKLAALLRQIHAAVTRALEKADRAPSPQLRKQRKPIPTRR